MVILCNGKRGLVKISLVAAVAKPLIPELNHFLIQNPSGQRAIET